MSGEPPTPVRLPMSGRPLKFGESAVYTTPSMRIESDPAKEARNRRRHKVGFDLATAIFSDSQAITVYDRFENGEDRWHTFGLVAGTLFLVVHTYPDPEDETWIRVIGLRKATTQERRKVEDGSFD